MSRTEDTANNYALRVTDQSTVYITGVDSSHGNFQSLNGVPTFVAPGGMVLTLESSASPLTTKGDLLTFDTAPVRLGAGANNTVLVSDNTQTTGNKWSATLSGLTLTAPAITAGGGLRPTADSTTAFNIYKADGTTVIATFDSTNKRLGIGTTPAAFLHVLGTTEQLRLGYDASNYMKVTVGSAGDATLASSAAGGLFTISSTGALILPVGTTGQEPGSPVAGMARYNSTTSRFEFYSSAWKNHVKLDGDTMTGLLTVDSPIASGILTLKDTAGSFTYYTLSTTGQHQFSSTSGQTTPMSMTGNNAGALVFALINIAAFSTSNASGFQGNLATDSTSRTAWKISGVFSTTADATRTGTLTVSNSDTGSLVTVTTWVGATFTNFGAGEFRLADTGTAAVVNAFTVGHNSSGTTAAGFGTGQLFTGRRSTTNNTTMGRIRYAFTDVTASWLTKATWSAQDSAGERDAITIGASGSAPMISVLSVTTPIVQTTAYTQTYATSSHTTANPTATAVVTTASALASYGYTQAQADDIVTQLNKLITDVANVKNNVNAIIDDQQAYGWFG